MLFKGSCSSYLTMHLFASVFLYFVNERKMINVVWRHWVFWKARKRVSCKGQTPSCVCRCTFLPNEILSANGENVRDIFRPKNVRKKNNKLSRNSSTEQKVNTDLGIENSFARNFWTDWTRKMCTPFYSIN
jgi:hypothetical protein